MTWGVITRLVGSFKLSIGTSTGSNVLVRALRRLISSAWGRISQLIRMMIYHMILNTLEIESGEGWMDSTDIKDVWSSAANPAVKSSDITSRTSGGIKWSLCGRNPERVERTSRKCSSTRGRVKTNHVRSEVNYLSLLLNGPKAISIFGSLIDASTQC